MQVVILDGYSVTQKDLTWQTLKDALNECLRPLHEEATLTIFDRTLSEETIERCEGAEAVLTNKVVLSAEVIAALPKLKYIGVLATGYNVVDCEAAHQRGILVTNIPAYSTDSVAQLVFAHLLNITNSVAHYAQQREQWVTSPDFTWSDTPLTELTGKTLGIYGLGNIGSAVARIAQAFGMKVLAVTSKQAEALPPGLERASWETVLHEADVITLHCPLTPQTRHLINERALSGMKPTAILINTGRGPLVDEDAVAHALQNNQLAAYCADVLAVEPPDASNPLLSAPRCFLTPHIGWATLEARQRLIAIATGNLCAFVEGHSQNTV